MVDYSFLVKFQINLITIDIFNNHIAIDPIPRKGISLKGIEPIAFDQF